ncbi:MAG: FG-GAP repeat protein [Elusimicrobia bacterium]|nr:FG-GAP repeat protein [Elusimicrobiota bacterium]
MIFFPLSARAIVNVQSGEENVDIFNDRFPTSAYWTPAVLAAGDFNGDGRDDVAVSLPRTNYQHEISLFFGGSSGKTLFSADEDLRILANYYIFNSDSLGFADLDGDGKKELVIGNSQNATSDRGEIHIIRGSMAPPSVMDLNTTPGDLVILGKPQSLLGSSLVVGEFNGDGREDLLVGAPGVNECYLVFGGSVPLAGTIDLAGSHPLPVIRGTGNLGSFVTKGKFNGDGWDDLVLSAPNADVGGRTDNGEIHILFGGRTFPSLWILGSPAADVRVWGASSQSHISGTAAGDLTADGRDELLVHLGPFNSFPPAAVFPGTDISAGRILDLSTSAPNAVQSFPILAPNYSLPGMGGFHDFDGDGIPDLFLMENRGNFRRVLAMLSTDNGPGGFDLNALNASSLVWDGNFGDIAFADLNGDAFRDLVVFDDFGITYQAPYGAVKAVYGFEPLRNPSVQIRPRSPLSPGEAGDHGGRGSSGDEAFRRCGRRLSRPMDPLSERSGNHVYFGGRNQNRSSGFSQQRGPGERKGGGLPRPHPGGTRCDHRHQPSSPGDEGRFRLSRHGIDPPAGPGF